jgi:hypothetical protein
VSTLRHYNRNLIGQGISAAKATYRVYQSGGLHAVGGMVGPGVRRTLVSARHMKITRRRALIGFGAAAGVGTIGYGFTSRTGKRSRHRSVRIYRKTAHVTSRAVAVPLHAGYGGIKGYLNTGSVVGGVHMGLRRGLASMEGKNPLTGRKNTLHAKGVRNVRYTNQKRAQRLSDRDRSAAARKAVRKRRRDSRGRLR